MKFADLEDTVLNEQYNIIKKLKKFENVKECINFQLDQREPYSNIIKHNMRKFYNGYPDIYSDIYTFIDNVLEKHIPFNVYDLIVKEIDIVLNQYSHINKNDSTLQLFIFNRDLMTNFYSLIKDKKHLLFVQYGTVIDELIVTQVTDDDIVKSLIIENKEYTFKIDLQGNFEGLCYYFDGTEKIVIRDTCVMEYSSKVYNLYTCT